MARRWLMVLSTVVGAYGCAVEPEPGSRTTFDEVGEGSESAGETQADTDTSDTSTESSDGPAQDSNPPVIDSFTVNGTKTPATVEDAAFVELAAVVVDDTGLDVVEFLDGEQVVVSLEVPPQATNFAHSWLISGEEFDGAHPLTVRAVDLAGNVATSEPIELLVAQPPSGLKRWSVLWDGGSGDEDRAHGCALTSQGRLAVAGRSVGIDGFYGDARVEVFSAESGSLTGTWSEPLVVDGNAEVGQAQARALTRFVDGEDLVVAGTEGMSIWVARYTEAGVELWRRGDFLSASTDYLDGVAAGFGAVFVAATSDGDGYLRSYDDATGDSLGEHLVEGGALRDVVVLDDGELVAVGEQLGDIYVARLTPELGVVWEQTIDGGVGDDEAWAVATHPSGAIAVAGSQLGVSTAGDLWVGVFEPDGSQRWTAEYDYAGGFDRAYAVALDPLERVVAAGRVTVDPQLPPVSQGDVTVLSYDALGNQRWAILPVSGLGDQRETGRDLCLDALGNIYVVGELFDASFDWWVARYAP